MKNKMINYAAFAILTLLWLGFGAALLFNREILGLAWQIFREMPLIGQLAVGLLTLPVVLGLWIWQTDWPMVLRLVLVVGLAWVTIYTFFPKKAAIQTNASTTRP